MPGTSRPVLAIGSLNMDLVARCERLPERGQTIHGRDFFTAPGGKGANQAVAAARLGARTRMAGCVGRDSFGPALLAALTGAGVGTADVAEEDGPSGTALITVDDSGANTIVVIPGANAACGPDLARRAVAAAGGPGVLLLQHEIPSETNAAAIRAARDADWFIILNPAPARSLEPDLLPLIDLLAPNETEVAALVGRPVAGRGDVLAAARALQARGRATGAVIVTLGADGAIWCDSSRALHCPVVPVEAVDTTAAGDAYIGALAAAFADGRTLEESLGYAACAAGLAVTRLGAQPSLPSARELAAFIAGCGLPRVQALGG